MPLHYAFTYGDDVLSMTAVETFAEAVAIKNALQAHLNKDRGYEVILDLRKASRAEYLRFVEKDAGSFMLAPRRT